MSDEATNNFTPRAQQVLALARKEADRFNHNFVGTEHLLLGLIKLGQGVAVNVLQKLGLDLETVRMEVEKQVGFGPDQKTFGNIPYTPRVKIVLALAAREAKALNHTYVGTEHILLGLLREGDGVAARILKNINVDIEQTRLEILKELDPNFGAQTERISEIRKTARMRIELPQKEEHDISNPEIRYESIGGDIARSNFTPRAQQALANGRREADRLDHNFVSAEHLLLGLLKLGQGVAVNVLVKRGVSLELAREKVEQLAGKGTEPKAEGNIPYTPQLKKALALSAREANALNHT